ncbi:porin family protein [Pontibacter sp. MBLB2868]|uniref:porin family protein n=1 Tax=Pontibacter sp. MBLB2868 TaxID=3451555 RepID=UPI003F74B76C
MKKISIILLLLLCSIAVHAQEVDSTAQVEAGMLNSWLGVKAGLNFSDIYGNDKTILGETSNHTSFHAGVFAQIGLNNYLAVRPEILYSRKGYEHADSVFRFDYLEVPILAVLNLTKNVSVHLGPQVNVMVSAQEEGTEVALKDYNTFDYGAAAGLEVRVYRFIAGARYSLSFEKLLKVDNTGQRADLDIHPKVLQAYLAIGF